jgi:hypothetical protein
MADLALETPLIQGNKRIADVTRDVCAAMDRKPGALWWAAFLRLSRCSRSG